MAERFTSEKNETVDLLNLPYAIRNALGNYALTLQIALEVQEQLQITNAAIELINAGLPEGYKVGTNSSFTPLADREGRAGYNKIYRPDANNKYVVVGEMCTEGASEPFLGDRLVTTEDDIVVINEELQLGFSAKQEVFVVDTNNDESERTLGGTYTKRFQDILLPMIEAVPAGGKKAFDCLYY